MRSCYARRDEPCDAQHLACLPWSCSEKLQGIRNHHLASTCTNTRQTAKSLLYSLVWCDGNEFAHELDSSMCHVSSLLGMPGRVARTFSFSFGNGVQTKTGEYVRRRIGESRIRWIQERMRLIRCEAALNANVFAKHVFVSLAGHTPTWTCQTQGHRERNMRIFAWTAWSFEYPHPADH